MPSRIFATQLAAKVEGAEGTKETLALADAVLVSNIKFSPDIEMYVRNALRGTLSRDPSVSGKQKANISFDVELKGAGAPAGVAPDYGKLLKGCGFSETIVASTSVTYKPATNSLSNSMSLSIYMDGVIAKIWGARGNVKGSMNAGKPGILSFEFQGAAFEVVDGALLAPSYTTVIPPAFLNASLLLDAYAAICSKVDFDTANVIGLRESINSASGFLSALITGRNPKGSMDPELPTVAAYDFYGKWKTPATLGALQLAATGSAGNIVTISFPKVRYAKIADNERNGIRTLGLDFEACLNTGDDEISIALT
jgi:hypothetical protein